MKKIGLMSFVVLLLMILPTQSLAQDVKEVPEVSRYILINYIDADSTIQNGVAYCSGEVDVNTTANITLTVELQEYDGSWNTIDDWSNSKNGTWLRVYGECDDLTSGLIYRVKVTAVITTSTETEDEIIYTRNMVY